MTVSWTEIFPDVDGEPVRAELAEFDGVTSMFERMGSAARDIRGEFERITSDGGADALQGEAADSFRRVVEEVAESLGDLPDVCDQAYDALHGHRRTLDGLRDEAAAALARARTRWEAHEDAVRALSARRSSHGRASAALDGLPPAGADPAADVERSGLEQDAADSQAALTAAEGALDSASDDLQASRAEWTGLRDDEDRLNDATAALLDDISLGDLSDPSWWESILGSAFDLVMDLTGLDALLDLIEAIATGDWAAALWALRDLLDRVLTVLAVVALFTPLGPLVLALVAVKLATSLALYATKWPHPETGQSIGLVDVAMDGADAFGAAGDVVLAGRAARTAAAATPPSSAAATPPASAATPPAGPRVLRDGEGATPEQIAASTGGPTGGSRQGQSAARQRLLDDAGDGPYTCWRCGQQTNNPANLHLGHRNVPTSHGGNLSDENIALEGAACNLSAGNRGAPKPGRSCIERGSAGAPYGRTD